MVKMCRNKMSFFFFFLLKNISAFDQNLQPHYDENGKFPSSVLNTPSAPYTQLKVTCVVTCTRVIVSVGREHGCGFSGANPITWQHKYLSAGDVCVCVCAWCGTPGLPAGGAGMCKVKVDAGGNVQRAQNTTPANI